MAGQLAKRQAKVLPVLLEKCEMPPFLRGKLYADFSKPEEYEAFLGKLLRRLRIS